VTTDFDRFMLDRLAADEGDSYDAAAVERDLAEQIGKVVKKFREQAGLSQTQLAAVLDASQPTIGRMEMGRVSPTFMTLIRLAHALNVNLTINIRADGASVQMDKPGVKSEKTTRRRAG
jgi:ribosome-binding protein aMBF1 (putative translation factor)